MLSPEKRERLILVLRLLSSDRMGERAAAGAMAHRIVQSPGLDWNDVIRPSVVPYVPPPAVDHEAERHRRAERERIASRSWARDLTDAELDVVIACGNTDE